MYVTSEKLPSSHDSILLIIFFILDGEKAFAFPFFPLETISILFVWHEGRQVWC